MSWRVRLAGVVVTLAAGLVVVGSLAWAAVVARIQPGLERQLSGALSGTVRWDFVGLHPAGGLIVSRARLIPRGQTEPQAAVRWIVLRYRWTDLWHRRWMAIREVTIIRPVLHLPAAASEVGLLPDAVPAEGVAVSPTAVLRRRSPWPYPVRVVIREAQVDMPGMMPLLRHGELIADWQGGSVVVHQAHADALGATVWAAGELSAMATGDPQWQFQVHLSSPRLSGQLEVRDSVRNPSVVGQMEPANARPIPIASHATVTRQRIEAADIQVGAFRALAGAVDWSQGRWNVTLAAPEGGMVTVQGTTGWQHPKVNMTLANIKVGPVTISSTVALDGTWVAPSSDQRLPQEDAGPRPSSGRRGVLGGTVTTVGTTVNGQAAGELTGTWTVSRDAVEIRSLRLGDHYVVSGSTGVSDPHSLMLTLDILGAKLEDVAAMIDPGKSPLASGVVNGRVEVRGTTAQPQVRGYLTGHDGKIGRTPFEMATINFEGTGSIIRFLDSRIQRTGTPMVIEGSIDLAKLGTATVFQHVKITPQSSEASWQAPATIRPGDQRPPREEAAPRPGGQDFQVTVRRAIERELPAEGTEGASDEDMGMKHERQP